MKIALRGTMLGYEEHGQGLPVVLIHGFPFSRTMWARQVPVLSARRRVITPDLRGFGESDGVPSNLEQLAADVHALIEELRLSSFVLGGFSMGGYVAFRYLDLFGDRVQAVMLLDTRPEADSAEARERRFAGIDRIEREGPAGFLDDFVKLMVSPRTLESRPELVAEVRRMMDGPGVDALTGALRAMAERPDSAPLLPRIDIPTLIVVGEDDKATPPESSRKMAAAIPGAELMVVPGAGHVSHIEQPDAFNQALLDFLNRLT